VGQSQPNKAVELTGKKLALFPSSSPRAFGGDPKTQAATDSAFGAVPREEAFGVVTI
jgi:hypothetical protein